MKYIRHTLGLLLTLALFGVLGLAFAQTLTPAGTVIQNTATATYLDANDQPGSATSNTVTTTVQEVYGVFVEPSAGAPTAGLDTTVIDTDPDSPNNPDKTDFTLAPAFQSTVNAGSNVQFLYNVTNDSNIASELSLAVLQDPTNSGDLADPNDDFDFTNVQVFLSDASGSLIGSALDLNQPLPFDPGETQFFVVRATVPNGTPAGSVANLDLVSINETASGNVVDAPNVTYDNNNIASVTVTDGELGLAKDLESVSGPDGSGNYLATFDFYLANTGTTDITGLTLTDDLAATFGTTTFTVTSTPAIVSQAGGADLGPALNGSYDGNADINLIDPTFTTNRTLPVGATARIRIVVQVNGPVDTENQATITGNDGTNTVSNQSTNGVNPDPNTSIPTPVVLENPVVEVTKSTTAVVGDSAPFDVQFQITVNNTGDVQIQNFSVVDNLVDAFGAGNFSLNSAPTLINPVPGVQINPAYTGTPAGSIELIAPGSTFNVGDEAVILLDIRVTSAGDYENTATASGEGPGGTPTTDTSGPAPVSVNELNLIKSATIFRDSGSGFVEVVGNNGSTAQPGDRIRYTILVENTSDDPLTNIVVTDTIPVPTFYVAFVSGGGSAGGPFSYDVFDGRDTITATDIGDADVFQRTQPLNSTGGNVDSVRFTIDQIPGKVANSSGSVVELQFDVEIP